jgi:hypothetical protein
MTRTRLNCTGLSSRHLLAVGLVVLMVLIAGCVDTGGESSPTPTTQATTTAAIDFKKQPINGQTVIVQSVTLPSGGYVAIHDLQPRKETVVGKVIGVSGYLEAGTYKDVPVGLGDVPGGHFSPKSLQHNQTLVAVVHRETSETTTAPTFDFVITNGREDSPYTVNDLPVKDTAIIIVHSNATTTTQSSNLVVRNS